MSTAFVWEAPRARVVFGRGALAQLPDELDRLGAQRALVVWGAAAAAVDGLCGALGEHAVARFAITAQHAPATLADEVVQLARDRRTDSVISIGGGSATGIGKAVAVALEIPLLAVPTTYAGSEMTPIWARTASGRKQTARDPRALPRTVVYDPELCAGMPSRLAAASGMNALAHCAEALWSAGANPMTSALALEGARRLVTGLAAVVAHPDDVDAHADNLVGACLAGTALAQAGSGIHHRTCHVLGGGWNLQHAETHAVILPHATALITPRAPAAVARLADALGAGDASSGLDALLEHLPLPRSLADLGFPESALDEAAHRVMEGSSGDPLVPGEAEVRAMLDDAFHGRPPGVLTEASAKAPTAGVSPGA